MLFALLEKLAFAIPVSVLFASGRVFGSVVVFGSIDFVGPHSLRLRGSSPAEPRARSASSSSSMT